MIATASATWARQIAEDIMQADATVQLSAISCLPPRRQRPDAFCYLWHAIATAAQRGVAVNVFLPEPSISQPATIRNATARAVIQDLGGQCHLVPITRLLHAKTALIDHEIAWVGSGNLTAAAANHNREFFIRVTDPPAVNALQAFYNELGAAANETRNPKRPAVFR